eukprot:g20332.t1
MLAEQSGYRELVHAHRVECSRHPRVLQQHRSFWAAAVLGQLSLAVALRGTAVLCHVELEQLRSVVSSEEIEVVGLVPDQLGSLLEDESVWSGLTAPVSFDTQLLQRRFALADVARCGTGRSVPGAKGHAGQGDPEPRKKLRVLDDRTSQLLAISFNKLPPAEQLTRVLEPRLKLREFGRGPCDTLEAFPEGLSPEALMALQSAFVEQREAVEQLRQLQVNEADLTQLDLPESTGRWLFWGQWMGCRFLEERYLWVLGHYPLAAAKIAAGALLVGLAHELPELRTACERVQTAGQRLRSSTLVKTCISTCLAVGNVMNRGTARDGARAVILPDGLLKLDELKGAQGGDGSSQFSLLDFVSEAIVMEAALLRGKEAQMELHQEALHLRDTLHAARGVCLSEAGANCEKISQAAKAALEALQAQMPLAAGAMMPEPREDLQRLALRVKKIGLDAKDTREVAKTKRELKQEMEWFSAKANLSSGDWWSSWVQFLELLAQAILRIKLPAILPLEPDLTNCADAELQRPNSKERIEVLLARMAPSSGQLQTPPSAAPQSVPQRHMQQRCPTRVPLLSRPGA